MNTQLTKKFVDQFWDNTITPAFKKYLTIPCRSSAFDQNWEKNGLLLKAARLMAQWAEAQNIPGLKTKIFTPAKKTPLLYIEIPGQHKDTVLLYGHLDKMPEGSGWSDGFSPWQPVIKNHRLYGRGTADDGYAFFSYIAAIKNLAMQKIPYNRCVIVIEASEESSSHDFPYYLKKLRATIGKVDLVVCFDVSLGDLQRLWVTSSLRGAIKATLTVKVLTEPYHSGVASGIIPSSFRIMRQLLDRLEHSVTGKILLKSCHTKIPKEHQQLTKALAKTLGHSIYKDFPLTEKIKPVTKKLDELLLNRAWRPTLCITGAAGIPELQNAGNTLRPETTLFLSIRIPPFCDPEKICRELKTLLTRNPPYGATITFQPSMYTSGWATKKTAPWLQNTLDTASRNYFGKPLLRICDGGGVGVIPMLDKVFPHAQFILAGAADPHSHEHGANESLHIPSAKKVICCLSEVLAQQYHHTKK